MTNSDGSEYTFSLNTRITEVVFDCDPDQPLPDGECIGRPARSPSLPPLDDAPTSPEIPPDAPTA